MSLPLEALPRLPGHYSQAVAITPADGVTFAPTRAIWVGTGGALVAQTSDGSSVLIIVVATVPNGTLLKLAVNAIAASGTTAANILALY